MSQLQCLAAAIAAHGTKQVFGITGSGATLTLLHELERLGVEPVRTYFEGSAALMAATVGRLSGRAGVCYSIKGPGLANAIPGLTAASLEAFPCVAIAEAYPPSSGAEKAHKRLDQQQLAAAVIKHAAFLSDAGDDFAALAALAAAEVPGTALLQLAGTGIAARALRNESTGEEDVNPALLGLVERSLHPVVIAGSYAIRSGLGTQLARLRVPVLTTVAAKGLVDESAEHCAGIFTGVGLELAPENHVLAHADCVIGLGLRPNECLATRPFKSTAVNIDPVVVPGSAAFGYAQVSAAAPDGLWSVLRERSWGAEVIASSRTALRAKLLEGFMPGAAFEAIAQVLGRDVRMILDTGYFCTIAEHIWDAPRADLCLLSAQARYMGTSLPMALGAAIHDAATRTVVVAGDGGMPMYLAEVRLAVERRLPLLFVLMSDGRYGSVATRALKESLTLTPMQFKEPSWTRVMAAFGMPVWTADNEQQLRTALAGWRPQEGPGYVEIRFDPGAYQNICNALR